MCPFNLSFSIYQPFRGSSAFARSHSYDCTFLLFLFFWSSVESCIKLIHHSAAFLARNMAEAPPLAICMAIAALFGMACLNCAEILVLIYYTFKRYTGLYFWSMIVATTGTVFYAIVNLLRLFALAPNTPMAVLLALSWWGMVTGQSVVLYSRLHLVVSNRRKTRWVLIMIVTNFFIMHIPLTIFWIGYNVDPDNFLVVFDVYERLQLVVFSIQEAIISGLYIWEAGHGLKSVIAVKGGRAQGVVRQLVIINTIVILLDISLIITEFSGHLDIQTSYQPLVYSFKLKLEFIVLNKLIDIIKPQGTRALMPNAGATLQAWAILPRHARAQRL
ncbi:hypothetical protein F5883DRAFT_634093 [Diaporthe sp. PMI_573]|nr:hypothetical protein F5883DRAFT_634093 [Diaporthaceae sp. PMI_573]